MKMRKINSPTNSAKIVEAACWIFILFAVWSTIVRFVIIIWMSLLVGHVMNNMQLAHTASHVDHLYIILFIVLIVTCTMMLRQERSANAGLVMVIASIARKWSASLAANA